MATLCADRTAGAMIASVPLCLDGMDGWHRKKLIRHSIRISCFE